MEYDTIEYWKKEIENKKIEIEIYANAMVNISKQAEPKFALIEIVGEKIGDCKRNLDYYKCRLMEKMQEATKKEVADDN